MTDALVTWLQRHGRIRMCPNCGGDSHFPKSLVKSTFWCGTCERVWRFRRRIEHAKTPAYWYPLNRAEGEHLRKVD